MPVHQITTSVKKQVRTALTITGLVTQQSMSTTKYSLLQCLSLVKITGNCTIVSVRTVYQLVLPSTICLATSSGSCTPFMSNSVIPFIASMQASNGDKQTYQPAQKNPTGQARNHRTRNQIIAQRTFMFFSFFTDLYSVTVKTKKEVIRSLHVKTGLKHCNVGLKACRFRRCSHVYVFVVKTEIYFLQFGLPSICIRRKWSPKTCLYKNAFQSGEF